MSLGNALKVAGCSAGCQVGARLDGRKIEGIGETTIRVAVRSPIVGVQAESLIAGCVGRLAVVLGEVMLHAQPALIEPRNHRVG
eukprot:SAG31_NODE_4993_length_2814_cov_3.680663_2_plen_84_part_00